MPTGEANCPITMCTCQGKGKEIQEKYPMGPLPQCADCSGQKNGSNSMEIDPKLLLPPDCKSVSEEISNEWCTTNCVPGAMNDGSMNCPGEFCECKDGRQTGDPPGKKLKGKSKKTKNRCTSVKVGVVDEWCDANCGKGGMNDGSVCLKSLCKCELVVDQAEQLASEEYEETEPEEVAVDPSLCKSVQKAIATDGWCFETCKGLQSKCPTGLCSCSQPAQ